MGTLHSVNVGTPRVIGEHRGKPVRSAIGKSPVEGRLAVRGVNVDGDEQADPRYHGGPEKAVYAYALEDAQWWAAELARDVGPGMFGENLTTSGIDCTNAVIGERWRVGSALLEVCEPRTPCYKLGLHFGDRLMLKRFAAASRPGAYLRIIEEGELGAGDAIERLARPQHGVTIKLVFDALHHDRSLAEHALAAPQLGADPRAALQKRI